MRRGKELRVLGTLGEGVAHEWLAGGLPERSGTYVQGRASVWAGLLGLLLTRRRWHLGGRSLSQGCAQLALALFLRCCPAPPLTAVGTRASHRLPRPVGAPSLLFCASASQSDLYVCHSDRAAINLIKGFAKVNKSLLAVPRLVFCVPAI